MLQRCDIAPATSTGAEVGSAPNKHRKNAAKRVKLILMRGAARVRLGAEPLSTDELIQCACRPAEFLEDDER